MNWKIGKIYTFDYFPKGESKEKTDPVKIHMGTELRESLVKYLNENAEAINIKYENSKKIHEDYYKLKKELEKVSDARAPHARKDQKEKDLEQAIKDYRALYFPKKDKDSIPDFIKAQNLFIRNYDPQLMSMDGKIEAVFGGKYMTQGGKIAYKWYVLSNTTVEKKNIEGLESFVEVV